MGKQYLGDGVYVDFDGYQLVLTTENGISVTNQIFMEPIVVAALIEYFDKIKSEASNDDSDFEAVEF